MAADRVCTAPFVGRAHELDRLERLLVATERGEGAIALIRGEAGVGKSSLAQTFSERCSERAMVLWGACLDEAAAPSFGPWRLALDPSHAKADVVAAATALGSAYCATLAPLVPALRARTGYLPPVPLEAHEARLRLYDAVVMLFRGLARTHPLLVVIDDLHWIDRDSARLLRHLLALLPRERWLFVGTARETDAPEAVEVLGDIARAPNHLHCELGGFDRGEVESLVSVLLGRPVPQAVVATIHTETGGVPFYVRELARCFDEGAGSLPRSVHDALRARLLRLEKETRELLGVMSLFSRPTDALLLSRVTRAPLRDTVDGLEDASRAGFVRQVDGRLHDLNHAILRRALLEGMLPERRALLRRDLAKTLAAMGEDVAHDEIATQYHLSRELPGAEAGATHAILAARSAERDAAHERAARFWRMASELAEEAVAGIDRSEIFVHLALAEAIALRFEESARALQDAMAAGARIEELHAVVRALKTGGAPTSVWEPLVHDCIRRLPLHDLAWARFAVMLESVEPIVSGPFHVSQWVPPEPAAVAALRASGYDSDLAVTVSPFASRTRVETDALFGRAEAMPPGSDKIAVLDAVIRDLIHRHADYGRARAAATMLLDESRRIGHVAGEAEAYYELAKCHAITGELGPARECAARVPPLVERLGPAHRLRFTTRTALELEISYFGGGAWDGIAQEAHRFARDPAAGRTPLGTLAMAFAALASALADERAAAVEVIDALIPVLARLDVASYQRKGAADLAATAVWHLMLGERAESFRQLLAESSPTDGTAPITCTELGLARMASLLADRREARRRYERARTWAEEREAAPLAAIAQYELGIAAGAPRGLRAARSDVEQALARFVVLGMEPWIAEARRALGALGSLPDGLTVREAEVLALVAQGLANKDVANRLRISDATVQRHLANAYAKIGVSSRSQATSYVLRVGLSYMAGPARSA